MNNGYAIALNEWIFDESIKSELRLLLYISSLTAESGYCYASNKHLADKFKLDATTISRKIQKLKKAGYITINYDKRGCEVIRRYIRLTQISIDGFQKCQPTVGKNVKANSTSNNNTSNNTPQTPQRGDVSPIDKICQEVLAYLNKQAGRNFRKVTKELRARIKNKELTVRQCRMIIDWKLHEWSQKPDMANNINPTTLFRPSNYDRYREEAERWNAQGRPKDGKPQNKTSYHSQEYLQQHSH